jgi:hypothetical protein
MKISLKSGGTRQVKLLRSFEKGLLTWNPETKEIEFVRWESIEQLNHRLHWKDWGV